MAPRIISLEGNIGAGKSTLLLELATRLPEGWLFLEEPVDVWDRFRDAEGVTMLQHFYADPQKYAFAFQIMAYTTRRRALNELLARNPVGIICERSLEADYQVFAKMLRDSQCMEPMLFDIYEAQSSDNKTPGLDAVLYLDVDVDTCLQRVALRGRQGEEGGVSREYLAQCESYYASWLTTTHIPVCNITSLEEALQIISNFP
jgi:deoxycitidine kinase/deoxyguanosine kinase